MAITLNLPPAVEQRLMEQAAQSGRSLEEYLQELVTREAEKTSLPTPAIPYPSDMTLEERSRAICEWAASFPPVHHFVDDSRESIYAGRGE